MLYFCKKLRKSVGENFHCGFYTEGEPDFIESPPDYTDSLYDGLELDKNLEELTNTLYSKLGISPGLLSVNNATAFCQKCWNEAHRISNISALEKLKEEE
jgi:hypothetical protein